MYNIEEIKELIALLEDSSLSMLEVQQGDNKVRLAKAPHGGVLVNAPVQAAAAPAPAQTVSAPAEAPAAAAKTIDNPMIGVFYAAPSPESAPYVSAGSKVKKGDVICIIEAMKCMNEIQAEEDCEIVSVLAKNGDFVEYGQPLFEIR